MSPTVNVIELIKSYQEKILLRKLSPRVRWQKLQRMLAEWRYLGTSLPRGLGEVFDKIQSGKFDIHLEHRRLEPSVNKLVMGMITSALFLGSAVLWSNRVPPMWGGYSMAGVVSCTVSMAFGLRLLTKIWRE